MSEKRFVPIGQLLKSVGTLGEIKMHIEDGFLQDLEGCGHFFIKKRGNFEPFFVEYFKDAADVIIKIEEVDSPESASGLSLEQVYLQQRDIRSKKGSTIATMTQLEGYEIFNYGDRVGLITSIQQMPHQILAHVDYNDKIIMLPLHESLITSLNKKSKQIYMELPEGILEL